MSQRRKRSEGLSHLKVSNNIKPMGINLADEDRDLKDLARGYEKTKLQKWLSYLNYNIDSIQNKTC